MPKRRLKSHAEELAEELQSYLFGRGPFDVVVTTHIVGEPKFSVTLTDDSDDLHEFEVVVTKKEPPTP